MPGIGAVDPQTDLANAERLAARHGADLRFVPAWNRWLVWDGSRWADDEACRVGAMCADTSRHVMREAIARLEATGGDKAAEAFFRFAKATQDAKRLGAMASLARTLPGLAIDHSALDRDPWLLNVANGTIDLRTGELRSHARADLLTKLAGAPYDSGAACPTWEAFLARATAGDASLVGYLQRLVGYSLSGAIGEHVLVFLEGSGANGKSTFVNAVFELLGSYAVRAPRGLLFREQGSKHETGLTVLHGARFATCAEIDEGAAFDEALVKDLTGGDAISARRMRENFWTFAPSHKLWIAGNHRPRVRGVDDGIWRRIRLVPWLVTVPEEQRDPSLPDKLRGELPGLLAWAVRGCLAWQAHGLGEPVAVRQASESYRTESDTFGQFLRERCALSPDARVARRDLRSAYESWSEEIGARPLGARALSERLRVMGVKPGKVRQGTQSLDAWAGVRLTNSFDRADEPEAVW